MIESLPYITGIGGQSMRNKKNRLILRSVILVMLSAAIIFVLYSNFAKDTKKVAAIGEEAPDFVLKDLEGNEYKLSDYRGKGVFLNFWGTWCEPCKDEMPYMQNQYKKYKDEGVEIIAINVGETKIAIENFAKQYNLSFPIVVDESGEVQKAYGIFPLPATYLINSDGIIVDYIESTMTEEMVQQYMEKIKPE
jgi:peroxiredoxin